MSNVAGIAMEVQQSGHLGHEAHWLLDEVTGYLSSVLCRKTDCLVRQAQGTGCLDKHSSTLGLFGIVDERVLVVVEPPDHRDDEQDEYYDAAVHPVDENEKQNGCPTDPPEFPEKKGQHSTNSLRRTESHVSIGR